MHIIVVIKIDDKCVAIIVIDPLNVLQEKLWQQL